MFEARAYAMGFKHAAVGAMVRSSYHADVQAGNVLAAGATTPITATPAQTMAHPGH